MVLLRNVPNHQNGWFRSITNSVSKRIYISMRSSLKIWIRLFTSIQTFCRHPNINSCAYIRVLFTWNNVYFVWARVLVSLASVIRLEFDGQMYEFEEFAIIPNLIVSQTNNDFFHCSNPKLTFVDIRRHWGVSNVIVNEKHRKVLSSIVLSLWRIKTKMHNIVCFLRIQQRL